MNSDTPLACDMTVFTAAQRDQHIQTTTQLFRAVQTIHDLGNGFDFTLPNESNVITDREIFE